MHPSLPRRPAGIKLHNRRFEKSCVGQRNAPLRWSLRGSGPARATVCLWQQGAQHAQSGTPRISAMGCRPVTTIDAIRFRTERRAPWLEQRRADQPHEVHEDCCSPKGDHSLPSQSYKTLRAFFVHVVLTAAGVDEDVPGNHPAEYPRVPAADVGERNARLPGGRLGVSKSLHQSVLPPDDNCSGHSSSPYACCALALDAVRRWRHRVRR